MAESLIPDAEAIIGAQLRAAAAVQDLGARIVPQTPSSTAAPWVRLTQLDAVPEPGSGIDHLIGYLLQLDCYAGSAGGQAEASMLARTVRAELRALEDRELDDTVISKVQITSMPRIPDRDFEPARERFVLGAIVRMHARP